MNQAQRKRLRDKRDREDARYAESRADSICEVCHCWAPRHEGGVNHHAHRKGTKALRHDPTFHVWLCWRCHGEAHGHKPQEVNEECEEIIQKRFSYEM